MRVPTTSPYADRFSIRDLELYSGIKAHTIRIWERRFGLLSPDRSATNIRSYGLDDLKALLNAALLVRSGETISKVASLSRSGRAQRIQELVTGRFAEHEALDRLKVAMLTYDEGLFEQTSAAFRIDRGFDALVEKLYLPLLELVGLLWQSDAICPAQEHFVSNLIRQKLITALDALPVPAASPDVVGFVLHLPENEIHELGLLYLHYRLRRAGRRSIYLGQSVPVTDIVDITRQLTGPVVVCAVLTVQPAAEEVGDHVRLLTGRIARSDVQFHFAGARVRGRDDLPVDPRLHYHADVPAMGAALASV